MDTTFIQDLKSVIVQRCNHSLLHQVSGSLMSPDERLDLARNQTPKLVDQLLVIFDLHEANKYIVYSDRLVRQIPRSYAANAYNVFQNSSFLFELLRLAVLWDGTEDCISIPNVVRLLDCDEVRARLRTPRVLSPGEGEFHRKMDLMAYERMVRAVRRTSWLDNSDRINSLRNFRHKHLAHNIEQTRREKRGEVFALPKYRDEDKILSYSVVIVDALHRCLNQTGFNWLDSIKFAKKNAVALWEGCTFDIEERHQRFNRA